MNRENDPRSNQNQPKSSLQNSEGKPEVSTEELSEEELARVAGGIEGEAKDKKHTDHLEIG